MVAWIFIDNEHKNLSSFLSKGLPANLKENIRNVVYLMTTDMWSSECASIVSFACARISTFSFRCLTAKFHNKVESLSTCLHASCFPPNKQRLLNFAQLGSRKSHVGRAHPLPHPQHIIISDNPTPQPSSLFTMTVTMSSQAHLQLGFVWFVSQLVTFCTKVGH